VTPVPESNRLGVRRLPVLGALSWEKARRPALTSHTVFADPVCVRWPRVIAGTEARWFSVASKGFTDVAISGLTQCSS